MFSTLLMLLFFASLVLILVALILVPLMAVRFARSRQRPPIWQPVVVLLAGLGLCFLLDWIPLSRILMDLDLSENLFGQAMLLPASQQHNRSIAENLNGDVVGYRIYKLDPALAAKLEAAIAGRSDLPRAELAGWKHISWIRIKQPQELDQAKVPLEIAGQWLHQSLDLDQKIRTSLQHRQSVYLAASYRSSSDAQLYLLLPASGELLTVSIST
ncbi:MAG: hypothetical protein ACAI44_32360 [Candidatus Sericytochromatia bacterium]